MAQKVAVISYDTNDIVAAVVKETDKILILDWENEGAVCRSDFTLHKEPDIYRDNENHEFVIQILG